MNSKEITSLREKCSQLETRLKTEQEGKEEHRQLELQMKNMQQKFKDFEKSKILKNPCWKMWAIKSMYMSQDIWYFNFGIVIIFDLQLYLI